MQNKAAKFAHHRNDSNWETLVQCRKIASICALFKAYTGERAWKAIGDRLERPCYLRRVKIKQTPWSESTSELYRPSDRCLSVKLVPTFTDRGCHVVCVMNPYSHILGILDQSHYFFFQVTTQLYSHG
jgi:CBS-domain-containing membrane protein